MARWKLLDLIKKQMNLSESLRGRTRVCPYYQTSSTKRLHLSKIEYSIKTDTSDVSLLVIELNGGAHTEM